jgi:hypothetical protein
MKNRALRAPISTRPSWADCGVFSLTGLFANEGAGRGCRGEVQGSVSFCGDFLLIRRYCYWFEKNETNSPSRTPCTMVICDIGATPRGVGAARRSGPTVRGALLREVESRTCIPIEGHQGHACGSFSNRESNTHKKVKPRTASEVGSAQVSETGDGDGNQSIMPLGCSSTTWQPPLQLPRKN